MNDGISKVLKLHVGGNNGILIYRLKSVAKFKRETIFKMKSFGTCVTVRVCFWNNSELY